MRWKLRIVLPVEKFGELVFYYPHMFRQKQTHKTKYQAPKLSTLQRGKVVRAAAGGDGTVAKGGGKAGTVSNEPTPTFERQAHAT